MKLEILYEDSEILVCYKPSGIATQTNKLGEVDMVSLLKNHLKGGYLAVIHRLDQPVEGLLVFAKTAVAAKELNFQLQKYGFGKYYQAVVWNRPQQDKQTLEHYLVKDGKTNTSRISAKGDVDAKRSVLHYEVLQQGKDDGREVTLLKVQLETGRHHQIRVQLSSMGCPIWGDTKYNTMPVQDRRWRQIALCAYRLSLKHPKTKKDMDFEIEPKGEGFSLFRS